MVKCEISFETVLSVFTLPQTNLSRREIMRTANLLLLLFEFFFLCILLTQETFSLYIFYLSFLLSFIISVYYVLFSLLKENKFLSSLEKCTTTPILEP